jgi:MinD-like ATPase involved in chromosome partitioning or flagellar assembly
MSNNVQLLTQLAHKTALFPEAPTAVDETPIQRTKSTRSRCLDIPSEAVNLAQRLFWGDPASAPHVVLFAGAQTGAGCSWVCARTGEALAQRFPGSACIVDANLRSPAMHRYFRLDKNRGLRDALSEGAPISDYVQKVTDCDLLVLTAGSVAERGTAWTADRLAERLTELRQLFPFVLIDSPAPGLYADVATIATLADGAVLVVDAESTHREVAIQAKEILGNAKLELLGAVLNKRHFPIPEFIYSRV